MLKLAMSIVRTRMAPSPTGELHIGGLRTLLYDYALARQNHGQFILRIEDTDQKRYIAGSEIRILQVIKDYGLMWDEGPDIGGPYAPYTQSERLNIYQKYIKELLDKGLAYYCFCTEERLNEVRAIQKANHQIPRYDRHCLNLTKEEITAKLKAGEPYVVRLKMPDNEDIEFNDLIRGKIKFNTRDLDDQVLIKSDGMPTYHFAVVVDDHLMKITHVFRGEEWLSSTPKHILLYRYFGWEPPKFAHLTVLLDPTHSGKMSKRTGSVSAQVFLNDGYLPEAMLNFLMLLGWNPGTNQEIFTLTDFVKQFSLEKLNKKAAIFDRKKLDYLNGLYIRQKSDEQLLPFFKKFLPQASDDQIKILIPVLKDRLVKFADLPEQLKYIFKDVNYESSLLSSGNITSEIAKNILLKIKEFFESSDEILTENIDQIKQSLLKIVNDNGWKVGDFFMVMRVAICGSTFTPPVVDCLPALGKEGTLRKLNLALEKLK
jgi:glutamyl-tRNA synthetase